MHFKFKAMMGSCVDHGVLRVHTIFTLTSPPIFLGVNQITEPNMIKRYYHLTSY